MGRLDLPDPPIQDLTVTKEYLHELYEEIDVLKDILTPEQRAKVWEIKSRPGWKPNDGRARLGDAGEFVTARELGVLQLLAEGCTVEQVAETLGLRPSTIKDHVKHLLNKSGTLNRTHAVWVLHSRLRPY